MCTRDKVDNGTFQALVRITAFEYFLRNRGRRSNKDWRDATALLEKNLSSRPRDEEIRIKAHELWTSRKDSQASEDWLAAEEAVSENYEII